MAVTCGTRSFSACSARLLAGQRFAQAHAQRLHVDLVPHRDDRAPVGRAVLQRFDEGDELGVLAHRVGVAQRAVAHGRAAGHGHGLVLRFAGEPLHQQKAGFGVLRVLRNREPEATALRGTLDARGVQRPAHVADHLAACRVIHEASDGGAVEVHRGLPLQERGVALALAIARNAGRAGGDHFLQKLQRLDARFVVEARLPLSSKTLPPNGFRCSSQACTTW